MPNLKYYIDETKKLNDKGGTPIRANVVIKNITKTEFKPKFELIGTHTARKTFVCLAHERGMDIEMIKTITAITREKTLRRYLQVSSDSKKEKLINAFGEL